MFARLLLARTEDIARKPQTPEQKAHKAEYDKKRYAEKRDEILAYQAQYYAENTEKVIARSNAYYHANSETILAYQKERRLHLIADDPTYAERERAQGRNRRAAKPELYRALSRKAYRAYMAAHPGRTRELSKLRYWANPEKARLRGIMDAQNRRARLLSAEGDFSLADIDELRRRQKNKCAFCLRPLGKQTPHIDHYLSLARGGSNEMSNLRLLHRLCNMRKHAKHPLDFGLENGILVW